MRIVRHNTPFYPSGSECYSVLVMTRKGPQVRYVKAGSRKAARRQLERDANVDKVVGVENFATWRNKR